MKKILAVALAAALSLPACGQIEYSIALEEDLSGTATLDMGLNLEKLAYALASIQKAFTGDTTEITEEELATAREDLISEMDADEWNEEEALADAKADLPEGVEMVEFSNTREDLSMQFRVRLAFDHISKLNEVEIDPDDATGTDGVTSGEETRPFGRLEVIEEGNTIVLRNDPLDPIDEQIEEASSQLGAMESMVESALEDFSVVFRIEAPFEILEHNATRQEGNTLIWEYDESNLEGGSDGVFVRYQR